MRKESTVELIIAPYKDPSCGLDWPEQTPEIIKRLDTTLDSYDERVQFQLSEENIGSGADWPVIAINIAAIAGTAFFAIPASHKKIRESLEEWKLIGKNFLKLFEYISGTERVITYPIQILFLDAIENLAKQKNSENAVFLSATTLEKPGSFEHYTGLYEFQFQIKDEVWCVTISGARELVQLKQISA